MAQAQYPSYRIYPEQDLVGKWISESFDGDNKALVIGFGRDRFWGSQNPLYTNK